jgi:hypothetical protein
MLRVDQRVGLVISYPSTFPVDGPTGVETCKGKGSLYNRLLRPLR